VPESSQTPRTSWTERLTAPFKFGGQDLLPSAVKLGSAVTLTAVMRRAAAQLGRQLLSHHMRYQVCVMCVGLCERVGGWGEGSAVSVGGPPLLQCHSCPLAAAHSCKAGNKR
jgi:hypothetical protein